MRTVELVLHELGSLAFSVARLCVCEPPPPLALWWSRIWLPDMDQRATMLCGRFGLVVFDGVCAQQASQTIVTAHGCPEASPQRTAAPRPPRGSSYTAPTTGAIRLHHCVANAVQMALFLMVFARKNNPRTAELRCCLPRPERCSAQVLHLKPL